jgi:hypothetical protein
VVGGSIYCRLGTNLEVSAAFHDYTLKRLDSGRQLCHCFLVWKCGPAGAEFEENETAKKGRVGTLILTNILLSQITCLSISDCVK